MRNLQKPALYYGIGLAASIALLAAAELIWLPAPLRTGSGMQWIEMIDRLYYAVALVPLCWTAGAIVGIAGQRRGRLPGERVRIVRAGQALPLLLRCAITLLGFAGTYMALFATDELVLTIGVIAAAMPLLALDMLVCGKRKRSLAVLLGSAALYAALLCPTGYLVTYPGMTLDMNRYARVEGGVGGGTVNGVLVFDRPAVPADWLYARLLPQYAFVKRPEDEPPLTETYTQVVMMKTDANAVAAAVAMEKAGVGSGIASIGVRVVAVVKGMPADGRLQAGDIIEQLDGYSVKSTEELADYMTGSVKPGQIVDVTVRRAGSPVQVTLEAAAADDQSGRPVFGVSVQTELRLDIPRDVDYKRYMAHIGGPSHGAMLTLALVDQLTPGGVTFGNEVAGTGTIEADGSIGLIGGIKQKAYAVSRTGADVFFVPAALEADARSAAPDLNIVPAKTIDDVLAWLAQHRK
ncbi:PDZ domain-containing protein [Paenibacillus arenilitoris]|uniref:PDZ domain-containing protein n=1 Tax=Paenibacillus arenilitoris TaxID=2772299 RepID=A0A927CJ18_9BACL|nr:PDZ domain-containing protein [Paenibacillus arenilitoris]MBD2867533.1 PDZ domain-containing protein [Paenibacillus arenilitoris]